MKQVVLQGEILEIEGDQARWSLTDTEGNTSYATGRAQHPPRIAVKVGDRFVVILGINDQGDIVTSHVEREEVAQ